LSKFVVGTQKKLLRSSRLVEVGKTAVLHVVSYRRKISRESDHPSASPVSSLPTTSNKELELLKPRVVLDINVIVISIV
jgi:hypothetical protein